MNDSKKKIGVLNCSHIVNFGSVLQSYAIERIVQQITQQDVYSIRYVRKKGILYLLRDLPMLLNKDIVIFKWRGVKRKFYLRVFNRKLGQKCLERESCFKEFNDKHFRYSPTIVGKSQLHKQASNYDAFVLGSDQVWHPINFGSHYYTMEWIPSVIPKIAYASSFGVSVIPKSQQLGTSKFLNRIQTISVREQQGAQIVKKLTGRDASVVVDPTLLFSEDDWGKLCMPVDDIRYIFCYFLGGNIEARKYAELLAKEKGLKIVTVPFMDEINDVDFAFGDKKLFTIGPGEFLSYIRNADYVVTDSFHGTVFSVIFRKRFIVFNRFMQSEKQSTNSRIDTLLTLLKLQNRRIISFDNDDGQLQVIDEMIDYVVVHSCVETLRADSIRFLQDSFRKMGLLS